MSISNKTLASVQRAGQSVNIAVAALEDAAKLASRELTSAMATQPYSPQTDRIYADWKTVARISKDVESMEQTLREIYAQISNMVRVEPEVLQALPSYSHETSGSKASPDIQDAEVKTTAKSAKRGKAKAARRPRTPGSTNEDKLRAYLTKVLSQRKGKEVTQSQMSEATGVPPGSMTATLKKLVEKQLIVEDPRGVFRLK
jgi:hypothetical protein